MSKEKVKVAIGKIVSITSGKRHAWYESNIGNVRKPYPSKSQSTS